MARVSLASSTTNGDGSPASNLRPDDPIGAFHVGREAVGPEPTLAVMALLIERGFSYGERWLFPAGLRRVAKEGRAAV